MRVLIACEYSGTVRDAFVRRGHYARSCDLLTTESLPDPVKFRGDFGCWNHDRYTPGCEDCEFDEPYCHEHSMPAFECNCLGPTEDEAEYADDCEHGARHRSGDLFGVEDIESYDLLIAHPPCTHLAVSGARWLTRHWVKKGKGGYWHDPTEKLRLQAEAIEFVKRIAALPVKKIVIENPVSRLSTLFRKPDQIIQPWQFGHENFKATCLWLKGLPTLKTTKVITPPSKTDPDWKKWNSIWLAPPGEDRWKMRSLTFKGIAEAMAEQWGSEVKDRQLTFV